MLVLIQNFPLLILLIFFLLFLWDVIRHGERVNIIRLLWMIIFVLLLFFISFSGGLSWFGRGVNISICLILFIFFLPVGKRKEPGLGLVGEYLRIDERDTMFARARYRPGNHDYEEYYRRHPQRKAGDDRIRSLPELGEPGGYYYQQVLSGEAIDYFARIERLPEELQEDPELLEQLRTPGVDFTRVIKQYCLGEGALSVGVAPINERFLYSYKGRQARDYGRKVELNHDWVILFTVEMELKAMQRAPRVEVLRESARKYYQAARLSITLEKTLKAAGYEALSHHDAHYEMILPAMAAQAGLGEIGRINLLMTPQVGPRVRLGAVSTTMPLKYDQPIRFGGYEFCLICKKCSQNCPSGSLSNAKPVIQNGARKWFTNQESCYRFWRAIGSDCGICMAVCPFSKPDSLSHRTVRFFINRSHPFRYMALLMDDFLYGKKWNYKKKEH